MRLAEHFAVGTVGCAAFAPSGYVVGVHFGEFPDFVPVRIFRHGTVWAVGFSRRLGLGCLRRIDTLLGCVIKHADIQKFFILEKLLVVRLLKLLDLQHTLIMTTEPLTQQSPTTL